MEFMPVRAFSIRSIKSLDFVSSEIHLVVCVQLTKQPLKRIEFRLGFFNESVELRDGGFVIIVAVLNTYPEPKRGSIECLSSYPIIKFFDERRQ